MENIIDLGIESVPAIIILCYLVGCFCRAGKIDNTWIPSILGFVGMILGIVAMFIVPDFSANNYMVAAAMGAVSGFAAVGINQVFVQNSKRKEYDDESN